MVISTQANPGRGLPLETKRPGEDHPDTSIDLAHGRLTVSSGLVYWQGERINLTAMQTRILHMVMETYPRPQFIKRIGTALYGRYGPDEAKAVRPHMMYIRRRMGSILLTVGAVPLGYVGINPMFEYRPRVSVKPWYLAESDLKSDDLWDDFRL